MGQILGVEGRNVSVADLEVFQQAMNKVGQDIRSKATNDALQTATIRQQINFDNGPPIQPCETYTLQQQNCDLQCRINNRPPVVQCQFRVADARLGTNETNAQTCDAMYGTRNEALSYTDGICNGQTDMDESLREQICFQRGIRLMCPNNSPVLSPTNIECTNASVCGQNGACTNGFCQIPSGLNGEFSERQCEDGCGQLIYINKIDLGNGRFAYDYENGGIPITNPPSSGNWIPVDGKEIFDCVQVDPGGSIFLNENETLSDCFRSCATNYACPPDVQAQEPIPPTIECEGGLCIGNEADVKLTSEQLADSSIKAEMTSDISNDFQSEVLKSISQINEHLNIQQFNSSLEMTEISQSIKNSVFNSIQSQSQNVSQQEGNVLQVINFRNDGVIRGSSSTCPVEQPDYSECNSIADTNDRQACQKRVNDEFYANLDSGCAQFSNQGGVGCGCSFTNNTSLEITNNQQAKSVVDSVFDSSILNNLSSKYTLKLEQRNTGIDFTWWIILICVGIAGIAYVIGKFVGNVDKIIYAVITLAVLGLIGYLVYYFISKEKTSDPNETCPPEPGASL